MNVTPNRFYNFLNKILRRKTYWTVAYNSSGYYGEEILRDDYDSMIEAYDAALDYFWFTCRENMYEEGLAEYRTSMDIVLAEYFVLFGEPRIIYAKIAPIYFEEYAQVKEVANDY